ncbi:MAG: dihydrofolate reductase family protein [Actinomycetes bacterium]
MERGWRGIVYIATSVDGYIARNDGDIAWLTDPDSSIEHPGAVPGPGIRASYDELMTRVDVLVMGRGTYEKVLSFNSWPYSIPVIVLSTTVPATQDERVTVVRTMDAALAELSRRQPRGVYVDGGKTIRTFLAADLIDEITLTRAPVLIGDGIALFEALAIDVQLSLQAVQADGGYLMARYEVVR